MNTALASALQCGGCAKPDALIKILNQYGADAKVIATHPLTFLRYLDVDEHNIFVRGVTFGVLSVGVVFFLLIPTFWQRGEIITPDMHELIMLFGLVVLGIFLHVFLRIFGGSGTLAQTIGTYGFLGGIQAPVHTLLMYPTVLKYGPEFVLLQSQSRMEDFASSLVLSEADAAFIAINLIFAGLVGALAIMVIAIPAFAFVHRIGYVRTLVSLSASIVLFIVAVTMFSSTSAP